MLIKKGLFNITYGKVACGITKILRAVQHTHTSNVLRSPLFILGGKWSFIVWSTVIGKAPYSWSGWLLNQHKCHPLIVITQQIWHSWCLLLVTCTPVQFCHEMWASTLIGWLLLIWEGLKYLSIMFQDKNISNLTIFIIKFLWFCKLKFYSMLRCAIYHFSINNWG